MFLCCKHCKHRPFHVSRQFDSILLNFGSAMWCVGQTDRTYYYVPWMGRTGPFCIVFCADFSFSSLIILLSKEILRLHVRHRNPSIIQKAMNPIIFAPHNILYEGNMSSRIEEPRNRTKLDTNKNYLSAKSERGCFSYVKTSFLNLCSRLIPDKRECQISCKRKGFRQKEGRKPIKSKSKPSERTKACNVLYR